MFANRVEETTTTTGTGNLTLAGAIDNHQTFNSAKSTTQDFVYWVIDSTNNAWETGVTRLSSSTVMTRSSSTVFKSSNSNSLVNFGAGTKSVFIALSSVSMPFSRNANTSGINQSTGWQLSDHFPYDSVVDLNIITANELYLVPLKWYGGKISDMGVFQGSVLNSTTKCRFGIYDMNYDSSPGILLGQTGDITPSTNTFISGSLGTSLMLEAGWYFTAYLDDGGARQKGQNGNVVTCTPLGMRGATTVINYQSGGVSSGWSVMPSTITPDNEQHTNATPRIMVRA